PGAGTCKQAGACPPTAPPHDDQHNPACLARYPNPNHRAGPRPTIAQDPPHNTKKNRQHDHNQAWGAARVDEPLHMRSEPELGTPPDRSA
ncbi:MAG: hypothetical protein LC749_18525, partial [Actinobacteria bacterium]|nr:hypothetical protein [Actinomycetota bacterium]